jgi:flagellar hook-associated protein 1 FlgK
MSFSLFPVAMRSAISSMQSMQTALAVTSNNIANANTDGYTKKTANISSQTVEGIGAGTKIDSVTRSVNEFLMRDMRSQMSALGATDVNNQYYGNMQNLFGTPDSSSSLSMLLTTLGNNLQALSLDPSSPSAQQKVLLSAQAVVSNLNDSAAKIQDLRNQANRSIADGVATVNTALDNIAALNIQISKATANNQPVGDLQDKRDLEVNKVADMMGVSYFTRESGELVLFTSSGQTLVDRGVASHLSYTPASSMNAAISYGGGTISPITVSGTDITGDIQSGRMKSLIDMRDTVLPNLQLQFDAVAQSLKDQMNATHNQGTAFPPPNTLTGTRAVTPSTTPVDFTGTVRIAVLDAAGKSVGAPLDLNFADLATDVGGTPTLAQIRDAINGVYAGAAQPIPGLAGATASIDASGHLVIAANTASNGIAINEMDSAEAVTGAGFSSYFGLNDFFVGSTSGGLAGNIAIRSDIVATPALLARGTLATGTLASGDVALGSGDNTNVNALADQMTTTAAYSATGGLPALNTTLDGYAANILSTNAQSASNASDRMKFLTATFNDVKSKVTADSGVNTDEELSNLMLYQNSYAASARLITTLSDTLQELLSIVK